MELFSIDDYLRLMRQQRDEHASAREELQVMTFPNITISITITISTITISIPHLHPHPHPHIKSPSPSQSPSPYLVQVRVSRQEATIARLKDQLSQEKTFEEELGSRVSRLSKDLEEKSVALNQIHDELNSAKHSYKVAETQRAALQTQCDTLQEQADEHAHEMSTVRSFFRDGDGDHGIVRSSCSDSICCVVFCLCVCVSCNNYSFVPIRSLWSKIWPFAFKRVNKSVRHWKPRLKS